MNYTDLWPAIQQDLLAALLADEMIGARPGVLIEPGDTLSAVEAKVAQALGAGADGKNGVGFLVLPIERARDDQPNIPAGPLKLTLTIQFVENVIVNRGVRGTRLPVRVWCARAVKLLKLYTPVLFTQSLVPATPLLSEFTPDRDENLRVGQIEFTALEADSTPTPKLNRPQFSATSSAWPCQVTIAAGDAPDQIFWTRDGSHPWSGNPAATLYDGTPINVDGPCLIRARSFKAGCFASDTAAIEFN